MRELKFRAWDIIHKQMVWPQFIKFTAEGFVYELTNSVTGASIKMPLMQYTGLKDKNGKEIYEGDIVKGVSNKKIAVEWLNVDNTEAFFLPFGYANSCGCCGAYEDFLKPEIIGNIHENPELLNASQGRSK